jgi:hypothetical protein
MSRNFNENVTAAASAARTATGNTQSTPFTLPRGMQACVFMLDVTVDESTSADLLDVYVQTRFNGEDWIDVVHFTQHLGNAGATRYIAKVTAALAEAEFLTSAALAAAGVRNLIGDDWAIRWTVVDDSTNASFTFSVSACPI